MNALLLILLSIALCGCKSHEDIDASWPSGPSQSDISESVETVERLKQQINPLQLQSPLPGGAQKLAFIGGGKAGVAASGQFADVLLQQDAVDKCDFHIVYLPSINPSNFEWTVVSSTNLVQWSDEPATLSNTTLTIYGNGRPWLFFGLKGSAP